MSLRTVLVTLLVAPLALAVTVACGDDPVARPCSNIPDGGCPLARGVSCQDPACEAVYACREGDVWELQARCPPREAGAPPQPQDAAVDDGAVALDAAIDAPPGAFGGPGCASLQVPDCSLGVALSCGAACCGCEDIFVCEDGAWSLWGACTDAGPRRAEVEAR